jgi:iron-sulfur cluster assembly protein
VVVSDGGETLNPPSDDELDMLERSGVAEDGARLACQAAGAGDVVVRVPRAQTPAPTLSGAELPVTLTVDAARFLAVQLGKHPGAFAMRLAVAPAGCSGLRYRVDAVDSVDEKDVLFEFGGVRVAVDPVSLPLVQGTTVRLAQEGLALRLRFDNPNARQSCGCGESFGT